jgi:hypothetical protein
MPVPRETVAIEMRLSDVDRSFRCIQYGTNSDTKEGSQRPSLMFHVEHQVATGMFHVEPREGFRCISQRF